MNLRRRLLRKKIIRSQKRKGVKSLQPLSLMANPLRQRKKMLPKPKKMRFLLQKKSFRRLLKLPARQNLKTNRAVFLKECVFKMADGNDF